MTEGSKGIKKASRTARPVEDEAEEGNAKVKLSLYSNNQWKKQREMEV
jgi:hypothetical protein